MELIAASRIVRAQQRAQQTRPYATRITRVLDAAPEHLPVRLNLRQLTHVDHN